MKKDIILGLLLVLITSCASRKVDIVKNNTKTTIDSTSFVKTDSVSTIKNNIVMVNDSSELEICPISDTLPMIVNGITYKNAILKYKKQKKVLVDKTQKITSKNSLKQVAIKKNDEKQELDKHVKKEANYFVYLWLLLIPIGMYIYRELKSKILL